MPLPSYVFQTEGSWESSSFLNNGNQVKCSAIRLHLISTAFKSSEQKSGTKEGVIVKEQFILTPAPDKDDEIDKLLESVHWNQAYNLTVKENIFPGSIEFHNKNIDIKVEWLDPRTANSCNIRFYTEGIDITDQFGELDITIDVIANKVTGYFCIVTPNSSGIPTVETTTLL